MYLHGRHRLSSQPLPYCSVKHPIFFSGTEYNIVALVAVLRECNTRDINHHLSSTSVIFIRRYSNDFYCQNEGYHDELPETDHLEHFGGTKTVSA
jgi:hypothetical protein